MVVHYKTKNKRTDVKRVDFMIIGAQKCGTTSLAAQLAAHPQVCFARIKEPGFFNAVTDWQSRLDEYHRLFDPLPGQLLGEASTMYTFLPEWQGTPARLQAYNPDLKLIYIMRQPVERVISGYAHDLVRGWIKEPPETAVFDYPCYINRSRYAVQIRPYRRHFPPENILLLIFEDYIADQTTTLHQVARFLGIDPHAFPTDEPVVRHQTTGHWYLRHDTIRKLVHTRAFQAIRPFIPATIRQPVRRRLSGHLDKKPYFSPELRQLIWEFLVDDVRVVETWLQRRLTIWRKGYDVCD
ncbi:MAG: hypothetical protein D6706_02675 [Chloroflexi bacterium]|nr:MAG: hypothetical protein D6706_02675 [Chloroflexota bacterium]